VVGISGEASLPDLKTIIKRIWLRTTCIHVWAEKKNKRVLLWGSAKGQTAIGGIRSVGLERFLASLKKNVSERKNEVHLLS
jgi:hypothetical protein